MAHSTLAPHPPRPIVIAPGEGRMNRPRVPQGVRVEPRGAWHAPGHA
jgi:hypothetical protein